MSMLWLVEADEALRDTLSPNLVREGYQVTHIGDGATALRLARQDTLTSSSWTFHCTE